MSENNKVFFIINKYSGTGFRPELEGTIVAQCDALNLECTIEFTQDRGHATELAKQASSSGFTKVFAVGGDGTVNEVAQGLVNTSTNMGIIPKGSGNGLARHLRIPMSVKKSLEVVGSSRIIRMDTIRINNKLSVNVSGIGFDGHVAGLFGKNGKRGLLGYVKLVTREFFSYKEFPITLLADGQLLQRNAFILAIANSSQFGNNATISPFASVCDELMDICFIKKVPLIQSIGFAHKMFTGRMNRSAFVEITKARQATLTFPVAMPFHIDGEAMDPASTFNISLAPASLNMIVPDAAHLQH